jgi:hypothetical protein
VPAPQYGTTPQRPVWSTGVRYDPIVHDYELGLLPGATMRPTAAQNAALNANGAAAQNLARTYTATRADPLPALALRPGNKTCR